MNDPTVHRQLIASVASLKSCIRSFVLAASATAPGAADKIPAGISRAADGVASLRKMLSAVTDQTISLPLETSKRLVEVELPELLQQLLQACSPQSRWPQPDDEEQIAALEHPCWADVQQLISSVFEALNMLCGVAVRACSRSTDPVMVLLQLASPKVMSACVVYMEELWKAHIAEAAGLAEEATTILGDGLQAAAQKPIGAATATAASLTFAGVVAAFSSCYSLLAAAVDAQQNLEEIELAFVSSLCSTRFLPVAAKLLMSAGGCTGEQFCSHTMKLHCQQAGWQLLTLALFLSGGDIAISPAGPTSVELRPGQHIPSSVLAAHLRQQAEQPVGTAASAVEAIASATMAAKEVATGLPLATMQQELLCSKVLLFLEERLYHAVKEMRVISTDSSSLAVPGHIAVGMTVLPLLPGRCVPGDQDVMMAALRTLRCWRALLVGPAGPTLPLASSRGLQLLLAVLNGALAESVKDGSSERQALRGRLLRVAVHCLQLLCGCVSQTVLAEQLFGLTSALSGVVSTGGAYWDAYKRAIKSSDLPYTGQVRCVDKATGDMLVRYTMTAQSALLVLMQLLVACKVEQPALLGGLAGIQVHAVMLSAGVLPAVEQLFRQVPVVSPAHVAAADLLMQLLPLCKADFSSGQLQLMATLRKFLVKSAGVPEPDRTAAIATAVKLAEMLGRLATCYGAECRSTAAGAPAVLQHVAAQLLPAFQVFCGSVLKGPVPSPCICSVASSGHTLAATSNAPSPSCHLYPVLLNMYQQLAAVAVQQPGLGLMEMLLSSHALNTVAAIVGSSYWNSPRVASVASQPGNSCLTAAHAAQLATALLETLLVAAPTQAAPASAGSGAMPLLHGSSSDSCLCCMRNAADCTCCSPKACSDVTPETAGGADFSQHTATVQDADTASQQQAQDVQPVALLSALLQSKLLPESHKLLQQLSNTSGSLVSPRSVGSLVGLDAGKQSSSTLLGTHKAQAPAASQPVAIATGRVNKMYGSSSSLRVTIATRRSADGTGALGGSSPTVGCSTLGSSPKACAVDGDVGGLLRGGSWNSFNAGWIGSSSAAQTELLLSKNNSSGIGSVKGVSSLSRANSSEALAAGTCLTSSCGASSTGNDALTVQLRLQSVLLASGQAVLDVVSGSSGSGRKCWSAGGAASDAGAVAMPSSWSSTTPQPLVSLHLRSRTSYSGTIHGPSSYMPGHDGVDVLAGLRASLAAAKPTLAVVRFAGSSARNSSAGGAAAEQPLSPAGVGDGDISSEMLFPVDFGLGQLQIGSHNAAFSNAGTNPAGATVNSVARAALLPQASEYGAGTAGAAALLSDDVMRGVVAGAQAAAPVLARACAPAQDVEQCWHELLARLHPTPVGCWNVACVNMAGQSEGAQTSRPCNNCKVASFCSKGCEKAAWSGHIMACGKLAAAAAAAQQAR